jgi:hypothetical protein
LQPGVYAVVMGDNSVPRWLLKVLVNRRYSQFGSLY